jgi:hypothetical protein
VNKPPEIDVTSLDSCAPIWTARLDEFGRPIAQPMLFTAREQMLIDAAVKRAMAEIVDRLQRAGRI